MKESIDRENPLLKEDQPSPTRRTFLKRTAKTMLVLTVVDLLPAVAHGAAKDCSQYYTQDSTCVTGDYDTVNSQNAADEHCGPHSLDGPDPDQACGYRTGVGTATRDEDQNCGQTAPGLPVDKDESCGWMVSGNPALHSKDDDCTIAGSNGDQQNNPVAPPPTT